MTIEEFLDRFASKVARNFKWSISKEGHITAPYYRSNVCPATAFYETLYDLGICDILQEVSRASDNKEGHNPQLREALLTICGLDDR
jgi:hypothetical protein